MTRFQAEQRCNEKNQAREVVFHPYSNANAAQFWRKCTAGDNFLISGGEERQRSAMLVRMLTDLRRRSADPVILLTGSFLTESAVKQAAQNGQMGDGRIFSAAFRNYHALYRLDSVRMSRLLMSVARQKGYGELEHLENYIDAFLAICSRYTELSLPAMLQLDRQYPENSRLAQLGTYSKIGENYVRAIRAYPMGTANLRMILRDLNQSFQNLSTADCASGYNLLTCGQQDYLICINVNSPVPEMLDLALAAELGQLLSSGRRFHLILNEVPLYDAGGLYEQIVRAKNAGGRVGVGICTKTPYLWARSVPDAQNPEQILLAGIQNLAFFHNGNETDQDLENQLKPLGEFPKYEVQLGGHGLQLFAALTGTDWQIAYLGMRNRVAPEDLKGYGVVLKGHQARQIHLYQSVAL